MESKGPRVFDRGASWIGDGGCGVTLENGFGWRWDMHLWENMTSPLNCRLVTIGCHSDEL